MEQIKDYHFYAAHRNETLDDKCRNIHGHTYYVKVFLVFGTVKTSGITMLFSDVDKLIDPIIKSYDHGMMINCDDPLLTYLAKYIEDTGDKLKLKLFTGPTSAEALAEKLFNEITVAGLPIFRIEVRETTSSTIAYYQ